MNLRCFALLLPFTLVACAAQTDGTDGTRDDDWRTKPTGPDQTGGSLLVRAPTLSPGATLSPVMLNVTAETSQLPVTLDKQLNGIRVGQATLRGANGNQSGTVYSFDASFASAIGSLTELTLAGVRIRTASRPSTWGLSTIRSSTISPDPKLNVGSSSTLTVAPGVDDGTVVPVVAGTYAFRWGINDGITFSVKEGEVKVIDEWDYAQREVARLEPPTRELPNACAKSYKLGWSINSSGKLSDGFVLDGAMEIGRNAAVVSAASLATLDVKVWVPCVTTPVSIAYGAKGAGPKAMKLGRLDVDDVDVVMNDGSKKLTRGSYEVFKVKERIAGPFATNTGLDMPPGTYRVVVTYPQSAGTTGTFEQTFTTP